MTKIEWVKNSDGSQGKTWNPVTGCSKISPGCKHCYAERMSKRLAGRAGYPADEPFRVTLHRDRLDEPLRWKKPQTVFVVSMGDLFHDDVPDSYIDQVFAVMALCPQHTFQVLTKRPERMHKYLSNSECRERICEAIAFNALKWDAGTAAEKLGGKWESPQIDEYGRVELAGYFDGIVISWPLPNVWIGVTAENQEQADKRIPLLLQTPAALRFVSVEPMLGPVDLTRWFEASQWCNCCTRTSYGTPDGICPYCGDSRTRDGRNGLHWVVCGGETGPGARPMHPDWVRSLRDQCVSAGVPFFFKSWGEYCCPEQMPEETFRLVDAVANLAGNLDRKNPFRFGKKASGALLDGHEWREMPNRRAEHE